MGSLFYINVPTREKEAILRQAERKVTIERDAEPRSSRRASGASAGSSDGTKDGTVSTAEGGASNSPALTPEGGGGVGTRDSVVSGMDVYEGVIEGKKVEVIVTQDAMAIVDKSKGASGGTGARRGSLDSGKTTKDKEKEITEAMQNIFLEKHLETSLHKFEIYDATWGSSIDGHFSQISFTVNATRSEKIINYLVNVGIGVKYESTLSVCSAVVYYNPHSEEVEKEKKSTASGDGGEEEHKDSFKSRFVASIKSRLTVAQVVQTVQSNAIMTFDFIVLILVAGMIAALGLLENSSVNLVASMLISPLMGPIMAGCFGIVIRDTKLLKTGLFSELVGLSMCLCVGFIFGACVTWAPFKGPWDNIKTWPTDEMMSRGLLRGIAVGAMVAIPSGAGVALSILGGNSGSLVGVAISASLLPPAVNCGVFWGMAFVISIIEASKGHSFSDGCWEHFKATHSDNNGPLPHQQIYKRNRNETYYCEDVIREYTFLGLISFALTMVNILLILIVGFGILKVKEVAPHTTRKNMQRFWKEDLKVMREYNKAHGSYNKQDLLTEIQESENPADLKTQLKSDNVFNTVQRRTFGNSSGNILESQAGDERTKSGGDAESGGRDGTGSKKKGGGFLSWMFGGGSSGSRKPSNPSLSPAQQHKNNRPKLQITTNNPKTNTKKK